MPPTTIFEIEQMIRDQVQENIHLDYKDSRAIGNKGRADITKDVSSFANSDGGLLIYGVREENNLPKELDEGVDDSAYSREWIEAIIMSGINPRLDQVRVFPIPLKAGRSLYVIEVGKSFRGAHQATDKRYYKRHNFSSVPMEDYEIADLRNRSNKFPPLISFEVQQYRHHISAFDVANIGSVAAEDVAFDFSEQIPWPNGAMPHAFSKGIQRFAPKQRIRFRYFTFNEVLSPNSKIPSEFSLRVSYFNPEGNCRVSDEWHINFEAYRDSMGVRSEVEEELKAIVEQLKDTNKQIDRLRQSLEPLVKIASPTGLELSAPTLRNLRRTLKDGIDPEPFDPRGHSPDVFQDVLAVDQEMAWELYSVLSREYNPAKLKAITGMTDELMTRIQNHFILKEEEKSEV